MKHLCLCLSVALIGCIAENTAVVDAGADGTVVDSPLLPPGCDVPVAAGGFTLQMIGLLNARGGFRFELMADGSFAGNVPITGEHCEGTMTTTESENLAAAMNAAFVFCRRDLIECSILERDNTYEDVSVQTTDLTRNNRFCHVQCFTVHDDAMTAVFSAALAPLNRVYSSGACTASTYMPPAATDRCPTR